MLLSLHAGEVTPEEIFADKLMNTNRQCGADQHAELAGVAAELCLEAAPTMRCAWHFSVAGPATFIQHASHLCIVRGWRFPAGMRSCSKGGRSQQELHTACLLGCLHVK
jgi:hypothetical protein